MTRRKRILSGPAVGLFCLAAAIATGPSLATAATITNADRSAYDIEIVEGTETSTKRLEPSALLNNICPGGCVIRLNGDRKAEYILDGTERVSIEDGLVYYDGAVQAPEGEADANAEPN